MSPLRRAAVIAAALITCIVLYTTFGSHSFDLSHPREALSHAAKAAKAAKAAAKDLPPVPEATAAVPLEQVPPEERVKDVALGPLAKQRPLKSLGTSLEDRLEFQYPYDPSGKFPGYIWQTWKATPNSGDFDESLRPMEASWSEKHPGFVHEVVTDDIAERLVRYLYASIPEVIEAYDSMPIPVLKADFFRYLILFARGGIYSDIDTEALKSASEWLPKGVPPGDVGLIVGIEADPDRPDWADWYSRRIQFCQWTIQAKPGHPTLRGIIEHVTTDTLRMKHAGVLRSGRMDKSIVEFTGPAVFTDVIFDYFNNPHYFNMAPDARNITWEQFTGMTKPKKVGDVIVLPITSFSPGVMQMNAGEVDDPMAFVKHDFEGSWKEEWEKIKPVIEKDVPAETEEVDVLDAYKAIKESK